MRDRTRSELSPDICSSKVILFLGAGASAPLGLKLMDSFMDLLVAKMGTALQRTMAEMLKEPRSSKDLEVLFERIEEFEATAGWCRRQPAWSKVVGTREFGDMMGDIGQIKNHAQRLVVTHYGAIDPNSVVRLYRDVALLLLESNSPRHLPVFTTNYDTAIEALADAAAGEFRLVDGFSTGSRRDWSPDDTFHQYRAASAGTRTLLLFKLHGSSTWRVHKNTGQFTKESSADPASDQSAYENALVWPGLTKAIKRGPYQTNYAYLERCLASAKLCIVIGFSFRDQVIRTYFQNALNSNSVLQLAIIDPNVQEIVRSTQLLQGLQLRLFQPDSALIEGGVVLGIPARFGPEQLPLIAAALSKLDFEWDADRLSALVGKPA
jgi:hypothetical protein